MKTYFSSVLIMSALSANIIFAQEIEEVRVTSSFTDQLISEIENPIHVVDSVAINGYGTESLGEALDNLLGVGSTDYGSAVGQPVMRGLSGNRVKVLNSGMVVRDVSGLGGDHIVDIDLNNIQQIEVVRGPTSLLYTNGGIGGIVNVVDNTIARQDFSEQEFKLGIESQSASGGDSRNLSYQNNFGGFNLSLAHKESEFGNFDIPDHAVIHEEEGPTIFKNDAMEYGAILDLTNDSFSQKIVFNFVEEDISIIGEEAFMKPTKTEENTIGYYIHRDLRNYDLDAGIRLDDIIITGSDTTGSTAKSVSKDASTSSVAFSVGRYIGDIFNMNMSVSSVERAPTAVELFMNGAHLATGRYEVGNTNLKNETSKNIDLTFSAENDDFFGSMSFYNNHIDNFIYLLDSSAKKKKLTVANYLQKDAQLSGYELEIGRVFELGDGNLSLSLGRDSVTGEFKDGNNIPRMIPARYIYSAVYSRGDLEWSVNLKDIDRQTDIAKTETATAGFQLLDARFSKTIALNESNHLSISIFANNLLDEVARNHTSFVKNEVPLPGRNFGIRFNYAL